MLPIYDSAESILQALPRGNRLIVRAPTGSGKSTQVPQMLLEASISERDIVVLQPRRVAARMLARRVAAERNSRVGEEIGYQVRMDRKISERTRVRFVTEGMLLRELLSDPELSRVGIVLFDEFHERHLNGDLSLCQCLLLQETLRPDLKLVLMSATLDTEPLQQFLPDASVVDSEGRTYPVDIEYLSRPLHANQTPEWQAAAKAAADLAKPGAGNVLIFMPGRAEIDRCLEALKRNGLQRDFDFLPLHGDLPAAEQDKVMVAGDRPRIVVATNIAETSVTLPDTRLVIDSGLARIARFDAASGVDQLPIEPISQASADQRAGRAGRTAPGRCFRLWTKPTHGKRPLREEPEIHRVDLAEATLLFRAIGLGSWEELPLPDRPEPGRATKTESQLTRMGALAPDGAITEFGRRLLAFPMHPRHACLLLEADRQGVRREACRLVAIMQGRPILQRKVDSATQRTRNELLASAGEHGGWRQVLALDAAEGYNFRGEACRELGIHGNAARQAVALARTFEKQVQRVSQEKDLFSDPKVALAKAVMVAFADQIGKRRANSRRVDLADGRVVDVDQDVDIREVDLLVGTELRELRVGSAPILLGIEPLELAWLEEQWPDLFTRGARVRWDEQQKKVVAEQVELFCDLTLSSKSSGDVPGEEAATLLAKKVRAGELPLPSWNDKVDRWITKVNCLAEWCPEWEIPLITEEDRDSILEFALVACRSRKDVKNLDIRPHVEAWLSPMQQQMVREQLPDRIDLPNGRKARVRYEAGSPPIASAVLQQLYDINENPSLCGGKVTVRMEILGPNHRPVQLTDDLGGFWTGSYPLIRKDLKGRYPKHEWR